MQSTATVATKTLLIGNLPENTPSAALADLFHGVGKVVEIALLSHGFAFVEMKAPDADRALAQFNGQRWNGQIMMVDEAHPRRDSKY